MNRGFSLVELSIVLVILGLLTGGILAGQSLIRASELRAVTTERDRLSAAIHSFRDKYMALPGDMNNAVRFWGAATGGTADGIDAACVAYTTATSPATCNGNGDGGIYNNNATAPFTASELMENYRSWQHLANAGLIEGTYTGIGDTVRGAVPGTNMPRSKLSGGGWSLRHLGTLGTGGNYFGANYSNFLYFGGQNSSVVVSNSLGFPIIVPEEAWNIDTKTDDGKPGTGRVVTMRNGSAWAPNCAATSQTDYNITEKGKTCMLMFLTGF